MICQIEIIGNLKPILANVPNALRISTYANTNPEKYCFAYKRAYHPFSAHCVMSMDDQHIPCNIIALLLNEI
jgi:hypothetical protein